jgi:hypothetical protein
MLALPPVTKTVRPAKPVCTRRMLPPRNSGPQGLVAVPS